MKKSPRSDVTDQRLLRGATGWQWKPAFPEPIGFSIDTFLSRRERQFRKAEKIADVWAVLLPVEMQPHCRPVGFSGGVLTVEVRPGPYLHRMQMLRGDLLREIRKQCPRSGIRQIRVLPGPVNQETCQP